MEWLSDKKGQPYTGTGRQMLERSADITLTCFQVCSLPNAANADWQIGMLGIRLA